MTPARRPSVLAVLIVVAVATPGQAAVDVRVSGQSVDVQASNAPIAEILDRLSRQTQMKVVYDGAPPRQAISLDLRGRTPVEAVMAALEGQGVNYALVMDPTGTRVDTLLVSGTATASARSSPIDDRRSGAREMPVPEPVMEEPEPVAEDEGQVPPDTSVGITMPVPGQKNEVQPEQQVPPPDAGLGGFSASPFAPTAKPAQPAPQPQATPPPFNP